ncbi:hypothetical protein P280DRAFT_518583 [Massarina eburnea CBS 473.64]|uniref:Uncharacterized protein n=1 Tax=Massarina eburnea CBS 473.64 TaxID=1395130 RepID=A0A6A6RYU7_9PLEO|nr:hypothetical protein P280DRAFT_518583 [Massarina eburnea CBS 473.64]
MLHRRKQKRKNNSNAFPANGTQFGTSSDNCHPATLSTVGSGLHGIPPSHTSTRSLPWNEQKYSVAPPQGVPRRDFKTDLGKTPIQPPRQSSPTPTRYSELDASKVHVPTQISPMSTGFSELSAANIQPPTHTSRTPTGFSELGGTGEGLQIPTSRTPTGFGTAGARSTSPISPVSTGLSELSASATQYRSHSSSPLPTVNELDGSSELQTLRKRNEDIGRNL